MDRSCLDGDYFAFSQPWQQEQFDAVIFEVALAVGVGFSFQRAQRVVQRASMSQLQAIELLNRIFHNAKAWMFV